MSEKAVWKGSALLGPVPPVLVSCGSAEAPNLFTVAWAGTICTRPPRVSISVRPSRHSYGPVSYTHLRASCGRRLRRAQAAAMPKI